MCPFFTTQLDSQRGQFGILFPPDLPPAHFTSLPVDDYQKIEAGSQLPNPQEHVDYILTLWRQYLNQSSPTMLFQHQPGRLQSQKGLTEVS